MMTNREKIIKELQGLSGSKETMRLISDVIALLKDQEAQNECLMKKCIICPHCKNCDVDENGLLKEQNAVPADTKMIGMLNGTDIEVFCCPDCRMVLDDSFHFCPNCGQAVKFDA